MFQHRISHKVIMFWLWAALAVLLTFIVLTSGYVAFRLRNARIDEVRVAEAQWLFQKIGTAAYETSGMIMTQVEILRAATSSEARMDALSYMFSLHPQEVVYYRADNTGVDAITRDASGSYETVSVSIASRRSPLFRRAITLREGEVYITPSQIPVSCEYRACSQEDGRYVVAVVTPVYRDGILNGALVVSYNDTVFGVNQHSISKPKTFFIIDSQGYYLWHHDMKKIEERHEKLPSSFFVDFNSVAVADILNPSGGRVVTLDGDRHVYIYPISPTTEMIRNGKLENIPAPVTDRAQQYYVLGFIE